jgi:hypothetical protein
MQLGQALFMLGGGGGWEGLFGATTASGVDGRCSRQANGAHFGKRPQLNMANISTFPFAAAAVDVLCHSSRSRER